MATKSSSPHRLFPVSIFVMMVRNSTAASQLFFSNPRFGNVWLNVFAVHQVPVKSGAVQFFKSVY